MPAGVSYGGIVTKFRISRFPPLLVIDESCHCTRRFCGGDGGVTSVLVILILVSGCG